MAVKDAQVGKLMEELTKHGKFGLAAAKAEMDRKTAREYRKQKQLPLELKQPRDWRTRQDPFEEDWPALAERLAEAPELEAKTLFEELLAKAPARYIAELSVLVRQAKGMLKGKRGTNRSRPGAQEAP